VIQTDDYAKNTWWGEIPEQKNYDTLFTVHPYNSSKLLSAIFCNTICQTLKVDTQKKRSLLSAAAISQLKDRRNQTVA
jgi:hypothetical protein